MREVEKILERYIGVNFNKINDFDIDQEVDDIECSHHFNWTDYKEDKDNNTLTIKINEHIHDPEDEDEEIDIKACYYEITFEPTIDEDGNDAFVITKFEKTKTDFYN